jgi:predicted ribosome quality control (RQC) complex YloA/Tae2 family protein
VPGLRTSPDLIRRLAAEIDVRFHGAKVRDVGLLPDGRTAIELWTRGRSELLCIDIFFSPPLVTVEQKPLNLAVEPGFVRVAGAALRGTHLVRASARKGDRLLRLTFGTRSRFGVTGELDLYVELVPRFGNVVLVKDARVITAAKEFSLAENPARSIHAGQPYQLPPLVAREPDRASAVPDDASVLETFRQVHDARVAGENRHEETQRRALLKRLKSRGQRVTRELETLVEKRRSALGREELRSEGDAIYAGLHALGAEEREQEKARASALFARYKKLGNSLRHIEERQATLERVRESVAELTWEAERAQDAGALDEVEQALAALDPRPMAAAPRRKRRKRAPLAIQTEHGSRILVGRSPIENAELTFHTARPNDLWFHAQKVPGAHVILQRDDRQNPSEEDIERAAELAAHYSRASESRTVPVDYTRRKYVRAQRDAPPGLVWYTNYKTVVVLRQAQDDTL